MCGTRDHSVRLREKTDPRTYHPDRKPMCERCGRRHGYPPAVFDRAHSTGWGRPAPITTTRGGDR